MSGAEPGASWKNQSIFSVAVRAMGLAWRTNKVIFSVTIFLHIFQGAAVYLQFTSFSSIVDEIILIKQGQTDWSGLFHSSIILGLAFLVPTLSSNVSTYFRAKFRLLMDMQLNLYKVDKQSELDIGVIETNSYQNLLQSAQEWGTTSMLTLQDFIFSTASSFAGIITSMIILWSLNHWLVLFAILAATPVYFFHKKYSLEVFRIRYLAINDHRIIANRVSHFENLQKAVDVILLKLKSWLKIQLRDRMQSYNKKIIEAEFRKAISYIFLSLWYLLFLFAAIALMARASLTGTMAVGSLLLAFNTYTRFYQTMNGYVESISWTEEASRYAARWFELFDLKPSIRSKEGVKRHTFNEPPVIEFKNVSFRYNTDKNDSPYVLENLSFIIKPGEKIAIVGVNGAGKTTLIKLLSRVYDPTEGSILANGIDLRDLHLEDWHNAIGILFQDFPVYNLAIRESIAVGRISDSIDEKKIVEAARFSGAEEFITSYDQLIWKEFDGIDLSKGQHQRLAVARMFYRNAMITILDEPTASIDAVTEEKIFNSLERNTDGRTVILITHRFYTVKKANKILMLEHGKIIEQGSHQELMDQRGKYQELYKVQANHYLDQEAAKH
jgi:ABC-type multidrug transport system fused ATPase/permease subunit